MFYLCPVSEDELTKEAADIGIPREQYVEDLLHALTGGEGEGGEQRRLKEEKEAVYSFHLTADHCHLSYKKISNGVLVSKTKWGFLYPCPLEFVFVLCPL